MSEQRSFNVEIPDVTYWQRQIKCQWGCPVHTDARGYVVAIADGRWEDAYAIARAPNPFASICGRVCGAPCEMECRRGSIDDPVTIRALKRFVTERYGVETQDPASTVRLSSARRDPNNPKAGTKVAIIGSGVAGMTAAHDLALLGYAVTVFEADAVPGGMLMTGVPTYRLPRDLVQAEIRAILSLGVELKLNTRIGTDITLPQLRQAGFEGILIAAGLQRGRPLRIPGSDLQGVVHGIEFLKLINTGAEVPLGEKVVVIGGGNVAFDVARSAIRVGGKYHAESQDFYEAADSARQALRHGAKQVHMVCLESRDEMPADEIEITEGEEEGVILHPSRGPLEIVGNNGKVIGLSTRRVLSVFDENGKFSPKFSPAAGEIIPADTVILSIGQTVDPGFTEGESALQLTIQGIVKIDPVTKATDIPGVFACGDVAEGAKLFIHAVASAQRAAVSIDEYLRKGELGEVRTGTFAQPESAHGMREHYLQIERVDPPALKPQERAARDMIVEHCFEPAVAQEQGSRCLKCHINTIFNGELCILCAGCVDVCPTYCLALVPLSQIAMEPRLEHALVERYGAGSVELAAGAGSGALREVGSAMLKDEELCVRCGMCAKRCPTGAVTMEHFSCDRQFSIETR
jgi:formate dehydrogenase (NADP+) beta subunit